MNKFLRACLIAFAITLLLHLISVLFLKITNNFNTQGIIDFYKNFPISFSLFFFPIFFSFFLFKKENSFSYNILKIGLFSVLVTGIFEITYFSIIITRPNFKFFDAVLFRVVFIGFFVSFFFTVFQTISNNSKKVFDSNNNVNFSWKIIAFIPFLGAIIYTIIILLTTHAMNSFIVWFKLFPLGILLSILSIHFFKSKYYLKNNHVLFFYLSSISIFLFFSFITEVLNNIAFRSFEETLLSSIMPSLLVFGPYFLFIIVLVHLYFLSLLNKSKMVFLKQQSLENQLNYQQLKNQLSPHFLFNNINVLSSFIEENPQKAVSYANNLADIYHYFLEQEKQDVIKLVEEIKFAEKYLKLLKDRFENGLEYTINIDLETQQKFIVATILQQVLENVIKHNIIDKTALIHINISSKKNYLIVSNNKNLKKSKQLSSNKGIENIKKRISFFTDKKVIIEDTIETYTIQLPIIETA
jgi:two-component system LytT family sensor kinase